MLGVCLEKKRSYCQFDSKLAQIVQQQGRNSLRFISWKDYKAVTRDLKAIYQAPTEEAGQQAPEAFAAA